MSSEIKTLASRKRSAARLAAVQAIYEMDLAGATADAIIAAFLKDRWFETKEGPALAEPDAAHFAAVLRGVAARRDALDVAVNDALAQRRQVDRLEILLRAILRAGAYELSACRDIPTKVVINEYLEVAHAFFGGKEPALVNAVLDRMAAGLRADEVSSTAPSPDEGDGRVAAAADTSDGGRGS
jgi:N utilization substance protein B